MRSWIKRLGVGLRVFCQAVADTIRAIIMELKSEDEAYRSLFGPPTWGERLREAIPMLLVGVLVLTVGLGLASCLRWFVCREPGFRDQSLTLDQRVATLEANDATSDGRLATLEALHTPIPTATPRPTWTPVVTATKTRTATPVATRTSTPVLPTPTAGPTRTATATPVSQPSPTPGASGVRPMPPALFVMLDYWNQDFGNPAYRFSYTDSAGKRYEFQGHPEYGALGGWREFHWSDLNPGRGVYNWAPIDQYIQDAQSMRVTLPNGEVIAKPVGFSVVIATADQTATTIGMNWMPNWVKSAAGRTSSCSSPSIDCKTCCTPYYPNTAWQGFYDEFVAAMGRHYDGNSAFYNLAWVGIATGVDEEVVERKDLAGCRYNYGDSPAFSTWCQRVLATYNRAFPTIPQFIQPTVHNAHVFAQQAAGFANKSTGIKVNGLEPDVASAELRLNGVLVGGVTGAAEVWHDAIPTGYEPKRGNGVEGSYWFFMQGLSTHPVMFDVQMANIEQAHQSQSKTGFPILDFTRNHLGKTIMDTPDVWIVLTETAWQDSGYTGSDGIRRTYGPHHGNYEYWLYEVRSAPRSATIARRAEEKVKELPAVALNHVYGWAGVRRTDQATGNLYVSFDIDDAYVQRVGPTASWIIRAVICDTPGTYSLQYVDFRGAPVEQIVTKSGTGRWVEHTFYLDNAYFGNALPGGVDFRLGSLSDGDTFVHRVIVSGGTE